jgi:ribonuclease HII
MPKEPGWHFERKAQRCGFVRVAGIDEAGRGPLAGPVVAAAVIFPPGFRMNGLADSKQLPPERRRELFHEIHEAAVAVGVGKASAEEIDRLNILTATHLAARRAVEALAAPPDYLLTDYLRLAWADVPVEPLVRGDQRCASVAAASIVAKVARDQMMCDHDNDYPGYGFAAHKGYGTAAHLAALHTLGPTTIHRLTFRGVVWFDTQLRRSKTFEYLAEVIEAIENEQTARLVRVALSGAAARLPERELNEIEALYASRLGQLGVAWASSP